jgi:hypothetical protein
VGTSATFVTALLWTACVERVVAICEGPAFVEGESALFCAFVERRALLALAVGVVVFAAIVAGRGWPLVGAC